MRGSRSIISTFVALFFLVLVACINPPARGREVGNTHVFGVTQLKANVWNAQSEGQSDSNLLQPVLQNLYEPCCPDWDQYAILDFMFLQRRQRNEWCRHYGREYWRAAGSNIHNSIHAAGDCSGCPTVLWRAWSRLYGLGSWLPRCVRHVRCR